jgi:WD40 repeat protein
LLGIAPDEQDTEVIEAAAVRQVAFVRNFQAGPHAEQCSRILTELAQARLTLVNPVKRRQYDASLASRAKAIVPPAQAGLDRGDDGLAELSSILTEVRPERPIREPAGDRQASRGRRKGWSSLAIAMQCAITGFTLVAAYYVLWSWPRAATRRIATGIGATSPSPDPEMPPPSGRAAAAPGRSLLSGVVSSTIGTKAVIIEIVTDPANADCTVTGTDVRVVGSAPGRRLIVVNDPDVRQPRRLTVGLQGYKPLKVELVTHPGGQIRTHVALERVGSKHTSNHWDVDARNLVPFPAPPLVLPPALASSTAEQVTMSPAELDIQSTPPEAKLEISGLDKESEVAPDGSRRYRLAGADGIGSVRARATLKGYKPAERTMTPLPGERRTLMFELEPVESAADSTARLGGVVSLPPVPGATWAVFKVHLDPVPRALTWMTSGLKARTYRTERGVHVYQFATPDGTSSVKFVYSAPGFKPLEAALTPRPGEHQEVVFHFAPSDSSDESRMIVKPTTSAAVPQPEPRPEPAPVASPGLRPEVKIVARELRQFEGNLTRINAVAITPDGRYALGGGADGRIRIYDLETGKIVRQINAHKDAVHALAISPDGRRVLSAGRDTVVRLWEIASGHSTGISYSGCTMPVVCVAFTPKGDHVCAGDAYGFRSWNVVGTPSARRFPPAPETPVVGLAVAPDNDRVYAAGTDRVIEYSIAGTSEGRPLGPNLTDTRLTALDLAPEAGLLVLGCSDGTLRLWDAQRGREIRRFEKHQGRVNSTQFSPDGKTVVSGGGNDDPTIRLWDVSSGSEIARFEGHAQAVTRVVFVGQGRRFLSGSLDRTVRLWDVPN